VAAGKHSFQTVALKLVKVRVFFLCHIPSFYPKKNCTSKGNLGKDSDSAGIARIAREYYGYQKAEARYDITVEDLKKELAAGNPVIIPAAGRLLSNPNFTGAGPLYHVLVLIGYNSKGFIANDPGTRRGEKYFYSYNVLYNAIHDFPGSKEKILEGRKAMVVIY